MTADLSRVLVVRADGLGDTILSLPVLHALRSHAPATDIWFLASSQTDELLQCTRLADRVLTIDAGRAPLRERAALAGALRGAAFDAAVCLSEKWWPLMWTRASRAPVRIGFAPGATQPVKHALLPICLTHRVTLPCDPVKASPLHEVERYFELLRPLGIPPPGEPTRLELPSAESSRATEWIAGRLGPLTAVGVHLSAKWCTEGWRAGAIAALCRSLLHARPDAGLVILEAHEAGPLAADVRSLTGEHPRLCFPGPRGFLEWASFIRGCRALVTMDTAAAHLAAMLGVPVVDVFEAERFEHVVSRWAPWQSPARTVRREPIPHNASPTEREGREGQLQGAVTTALGELL
jgi:ADP-heptose:LPS heptosyltransferase